MEFREKRNLQKSIHFYLETQLNANFNNITTVLTFKQATKASKPVVAVTLSGTETVFKEIGSNNIWDSHLVNIDIFAKSWGQAQDLADFIKNEIKGGCVYYIYSHTSGTYTSLESVADGRVKLVNWIRDEQIDLGANMSESDQFRHTISITVRKT